MSTRGITVFSSKGAGRGRFIAERNAKGQFISILYCGQVKGIPTIIVENRRAIRVAIEEGLINAMEEMLPTVALKTGKMRAVLQKAAQSVAAAETTSIDNRITIDVNDVTLFADAIAKYIKYHLYPTGVFGDSYKEPFTPKTKPFDMFDFRDKVIINITRRIKLKHRDVGFEAR